MKKKIYLFILCFLFNLCTTRTLPLQAKELYGYVTVKKLFIRNKPSLKGNKLGHLTVGDKITILSRSKKKNTIAGKHDYWLKFQMGPQKGWVFGGFISMKPVYTEAMLRKILQGTYMYFDKPGSNRTRLLIIKGNTYIERWYNNNFGISDEFTGTVIFQAFDIILLPKTRLSRPSVYIDIPQNTEEENAYAYIYRMYDDNPGRLKKISRLKAKDGYKKLFIIVNDKTIFLISKKRKEEIEKQHITQRTKMYPAYKKY